MLWGAYKATVGDKNAFLVWSAISRKHDGFTWMRQVTSQVFVPIVTNPGTPVETPISSVQSVGMRARRYLGIHDLCCAGARDAADDGAMVVKVFEDALGAIQIANKYPDKLVIHRKYFTHAPSPDDLVRQHGIDPNSPSNTTRIFIEGPNESDSPGFAQEPDDIARQAAYEAEMMRLVERGAPNSRVLGFCKAHGNPDFTRPEICEAVRTHYAPLYNSGKLWIGLHNYFLSPPSNPKNFRFYDPIWFERRADFLFTKCGFDPNIRHILPSESGGECGQGGMKWAGFTQDEFESWARYYISVMSAPITVNGKQYESPYVGSTLFQRRGSLQNRWQGYEVEDYYGVIKKLWSENGPEKRSTLERIASTELLHFGNAPDARYTPRPKAFERGSVSKTKWRLL
jgi:hypothetical protein